MDRNMFRKLVNWVGLLIVIHIAAWLLFGFFISREILAAYTDKQLNLARIIVFVFDFVIMIVASVFYTYTVTSLPDYKNNLKNALKTDDFSIISYFKDNYLKEFLFKICAYTVFQLPYTFLFAIRGLVLIGRTGFDRFYSLDIGGYAITDSAILGLILNTVLFGVIFISSNLAGLYLSKRSIEEIL